MKNFFVTSLLFLNLIASTFSQSSNNSKSFTLQGVINGENSGRIVLNYSGENSKWIQDTVSIKNGEFVFNGKIIEPTKAQLNGGNDLNSVQIYLEPGIMKITLAKDKFGESKMTGSKTQLELNLLNELEKPIYTKLALFKEQMTKINDSIKNTSIASVKYSLEKRSEKIDKLWMKSHDDLDKIRIQFVLDHPKSYVTPYYLDMLGSNEVISLDSLKSIFSKLDISIQGSKFGKRIQDNIRKKGNSSIGSIVPDFKAVDIITNKLVTYSQFKGKNVVLLDFWASWCGPCRAAFPHLKDSYKKYHSKGFEVIGVSIDMNKKAWISAIKQDSIDIWYQVPVAERYAEGPAFITKDDIYENYFVQAIPVQILIDKNGKIIGRWTGYSIENERDLDEKLAILFRKD